MQDKNGKLGDNLIVGAEKIAIELGFYDKKGKPNCRRVYHLAEVNDEIPISKVEGLGLVAKLDELEDYFSGRSQNQNRTDV